jgi:glucose-6-phosphate 1-epimerase
MFARCEAVALNGQPGLRLSLPDGDSAVVALHGAQVVSWVAQGRERLYLSPRAVWNGQAAIRGGIPVCFPQFNQRGPQPGLPKHGFARQLPWAPGPASLATDNASLSLALDHLCASAWGWTLPFQATVTVTLTPGSLQVALAVAHTGAAEQTLAFTAALHSYLAVDDIGRVQLHGLQGQSEWDALSDVHRRVPGPLSISLEFDRVYSAAPQPLALQDGTQRLQVAQGGFDQTVVWNPGPDLCANLPDMPPDGFRHMLCVEAACVDAPVALPAGGSWCGWQRLSLA